MLFRSLAAVGQRIADEARAIGRLFRRSPEWVVIIFAWIAAGFIPAFWYMGETHWWSDVSSPLIVQPFVPLLCAALLWQDREILQDAWNRTSARKRRGTPLVLWLGCVVVAVAQLIHVITVAAVGLLIVAVGIVLLAYGTMVLAKTTRAFLFGLLLIPLPETIPAKAQEFAGAQVWRIITIGLQKFGKDCSMTPGGDKISFEMQGQVFPVANSQITAAVIAAFVLLFVGVWRREKVANTLLFMASGALLSLSLTILLPFIVLLLPISPLTNTLVAINPVIYAVLSLTIVLLVRGRLKALGGALTQSSRTLGKMSQAAQKATDRATSGMASGVVGGTVGRASRSVNKGTEAAIDKLFTALTKPFKRKRRDRW